MVIQEHQVKGTTISVQELNISYLHKNKKLTKSSLYHINAQVELNTN